MLKELPFTYQIIKSKRKSSAIEIQKDGRVFVRVPLYVSNKQALEFLVTQEDWVKKSLQKVKAKHESQKNIEPIPQASLENLRKEAKIYFPLRVAFFAQKMGVSYGNITIRCQKTRWGSCSSKGNLNFNVLLMLAPKEVLDYVVVHELSHRKEMNHSKRFWQEVENVLPNYKESYVWLKQHGDELMQRGGRTI